MAGLSWGRVVPGAVSLFESVLLEIFHTNPEKCIVFERLQNKWKETKWKRFKHEEEAADHPLIFGWETQDFGIWWEVGCCVGCIVVEVFQPEF